MEKDSIVTVSFNFEMPVLPPGEYSVAVSIAEGTQERNQQHTWVHDAFVFRSLTKNDKNGAVGIKVIKEIMVS